MNGTSYRYPGYSPFIIRPFDSVHVPKDISCKWPCYAKSLYSEWDSKKNAVDYYAMRPIITTDQYLENLKKMFKKLSRGSDGPVNLPRNLQSNAVFCNVTSEKIMKFIMTEINSEVYKMPEMQNNGPWKVEQFFYTDVSLFQFNSTNDTIYYYVMFNLYNPLRSTGNMVYCLIKLLKSDISGTGFESNFVIDYIDFINGEKWFGNKPVDGITPYNSGNYNSEDDIYKKGNSVGGRPYFDWNYGNTLQKQEYNKFGFYEPGKNIEIMVSIPDKFKNAKSSGYLPACVGPQFVNGHSGPKDVRYPYYDTSNNFTDVPFYKN